MKAHVINLQVHDGHVTCHPDPSQEQFRIGDTITFVSQTGKPTVDFDEPHTLSAAKYEDGDPPLTIVKPGNFVFHCGLKLANGQTIGWPADPKSGGSGTPLSA